MRDGKPYPPAGIPTDLVVSPGAGDALRELRAAGFALVVVTNQPDVARGTTPRATVDAINAALARRAAARRRARLRARRRRRLRLPQAQARAAHDRRRAARDRPRPQLPGRRPLARHRSRLGGGLPNGSRRPRVRGTRRVRRPRRARRFGPRSGALDHPRLQEQHAPTRRFARHRLSRRPAGQTLRRRRRSRRHREARRGPAHRRLHHQPDAHAQSGHHRLRDVRAARARDRGRAPDLVRSVRRRRGRDAAPGAQARELGRERVREDPGHRHAAQLHRRARPRAHPRRA